MTGYQSKHDAENERAAFEEIERAFGVTIIRFDQMSPVDALALKNEKPASFIEFKARNLTYDDMYDTIILDLKKAEYGQQLAERFGVRFLFVVKLLDRLLYYNVTPKINLLDMKITKVKLKVPRDHMDYDTVVHFPLADFKVMNDDPTPVPTRQP